ncbi:MAG TPA: hypothetical protein VGM42_04155, partial [Rhodopila sp.]
MKIDDRVEAGTTNAFAGQGEEEVLVDQNKGPGKPMILSGPLAHLGASPGWRYREAPHQGGNPEDGIGANPDQRRVQ